MSESSIQKAIIDYLTLMENQGKCYFFRSGSGMIKTEKGNYFKTGKAGCPDISLLTKDGFVAIEVKDAKGKLSQAQVEAKNKIESLGGRYIVARSLDDVVELFTKGK
jgi:hypothetical protein